MAIAVHPSEFAYAFAYARAEEIVGWGGEPFRPAPGGEGDWLSGGERRLVAAGRLVGTPEEGLNFTEDMTSAVLALVDPGIVLMAQRKAGEGVRTLTVHAAGDDLIGLTRDADGMFELVRYDDLTAAAAACAAFAGAGSVRPPPGARAETDPQGLAGVRGLARGGQTEAAAAALVAAGMGAGPAGAAAQALAAPAAAGMVSVLYCRGNAVEDAETFSLVTGAADDSWIAFSPGSDEGPMVLEQTSVAALAARIGVGVAARTAR